MPKRFRFRIEYFYISSNLKLKDEYTKIANNNGFYDRRVGKTTSNVIYALYQQYLGKSVVFVCRDKAHSNYISNLYHKYRLLIMKNLKIKIPHNIVFESYSANQPRIAYRSANSVTVTDL